MQKITRKTKSKLFRNKTKKLSNISSKSNLYKYLDYEWTTTPLKKLIALYNKIHKLETDFEAEHILEDDILCKYILEIENGTIRNKDIHKMARLIKIHILDKKRKKYYSG